MSTGRDALQVLEQLKPKFHPDPAVVGGALENQFTGGPREVQGAGGASYAISNPVLQYIADLPASDWTSVESGCGYSTVVLANVFGTHICVNPDLASNRLVRDFVEQHSGATGLRHVEMSSDQGLPQLVAEGTRVDLALIDGNHSHPFPILDFHYMDRMLAVGGRLLVDNTEIEAVQELTDYLEMEPAYDIERLIGNCAVYRKVRDRAFGWKSQVLRRAPEDAHAARREVARLRMEVAPDLRAALSGATPLPEPAAASARTGAATPVPRPAAAESVPATPDPAPTPQSTLLRRARFLVRWYRTPSGLLAGAALLVLAAGIALPGLWRLIAVGGVGLLAVFLPYRFLREQGRVDRQLVTLRRDLNRQLASRVDDATRRFDDATSRLDTDLARHAAAATESASALDDRITSLAEHLSQELAALQKDSSEATTAVAKRLDHFETRLAPTRRFTAPKPEESRLLELTMRDATDSLMHPDDSTG